MKTLKFLNKSITHNPSQNAMRVGLWITKKGAKWKEETGILHSAAARNMLTITSEFSERSEKREWRCSKGTVPAGLSSIRKSSGTI